MAYDDDSLLGGLAPQREGMGGLLGSLGSDKMAYMAMIAKGLNPWSELDPMAMMKLAQAQKEHAINQQFRRQQLDLSRRGQDREDAEFDYKRNEQDQRKQMLENQRQSDTTIFSDAAQAGGAGFTREQIYKYRVDHPNLSPKTEGLLDKMLLNLDARDNRAAEKAASNEEKPLPGEAAGRLSLADSYLRKAPKIGEAIDKGEMTGPIDVFKGRQGLGEQGILMGDIKSGVDSLRRMLSGAGIPQAEADEYVKRYEPTYLDSTTTLRKKHDRLVEEITGARENIMRGRGSAPAPSQVGSGATQSAPKRLRYNPQTGALE